MTTPICPTCGSLRAVPSVRGGDLDALIRAVAAVARVSPEAIRGRARRGRIIEARHTVMYLAVTDLGMSLQDVAEAMDRDHTTIMYGRDRTLDRLDDGDVVTTTIVERVRAMVPVDKLGAT